MREVQFASPNITLEDWQHGRKNDIDIFADQVQGWVFDQAEALISRPRQVSDHSGHALLALTAPYFEMISCYLQGRRTPDRQATQFLKNGLKTVLGNVPDRAVKKYVTEVRNGIAHELMFRTVILHRCAPGLPTFGMHPQLGILVIDPFWLFGEVRKHFVAYVARLRNPATPEDHKLLANFNTFMAYRKRK